MPLLSRSRTLRCWFLGTLLAATAAQADQWLDTHDAPTTSWQAAPGTTQVVRQKRVRLTERPTGNEQAAPTIGAEQVVYATPAGHSAWWWCDVPQAAVIDELRIVAQVRATAPGTKLVAEVALPRSLDPETNKPRRLIVHSLQPQFLGPGDLELLLSGLPRSVIRATRSHRLADRNVVLDPNGAYLTRVGLVTPGMTQAAPFWVKSLQLEGLVLATDQVAVANDSSTPNPEGSLQPTSVSLGSDGFRIDGVRFFPRAWSRHDEPLSELSRLGFNTMLLDRAPSGELLRDAALKGLKIIAPPPEPASVASSPGPWSPVLAWVLPGSRQSTNLDTLLAEVENARSLPAAAQRPLLAWAGDAPAALSRLVDGLLVSPEGSRLGNTPPLSQGLLTVKRAVRPGTPLLAVIPSNLSPQAQSQLDAMQGGGSLPAWLPPSDVARSIHVALAAGCRGILGSASEGLEPLNDEASLAARWLAAKNVELKLIEPWITSPDPPALLAAEEGFLLNQEGVRLAVALPFEPQGANTLVLPGAGALSRVERLTPCGLHPVSADRAVGGLRVERPHAARPGLLLATNNPRVLITLRQYTSRLAPKEAANWLHLARESLRQSEALDPQSRADARQELASASLSLAGRDFAAAYDRAYGVAERVELAARVRRHTAQQQGPLHESSPLALLPKTLTDHFRLTQMLAAAPRGKNRLAGGDFEDIDTVRREGWRRGSVPSGEDLSQVELASDQPMHGKRLLRLTSNDPSAFGQRAPRIVSPTIDLTSGELIEVTGWARVEHGTLLVSDSLGGEELSLSVPAGESWQPFRLLRRAVEPTTMQLAFSVEGIGSADVDGVMVRPITLPVGHPGYETATRRKAHPK